MTTHKGIHRRYRYQEEEAHDVTTTVVIIIIVSRPCQFGKPHVQMAVDTRISSDVKRRSKDSIAGVFCLGWMDTFCR
jgi:hypothetical protein